MSRSAEYLMMKYGWYEGLARAMNRASGCCEYCDEDLLKSRPGYSSITLDHILPRSKYPDEEWYIENHALCCTSCNTMKRHYDPLNKGEYEKGIMETRRSEIVQRVRAHLAPMIEDRQREWDEIRAKYRS